MCIVQLSASCLAVGVGLRVRQRLPWVVGVVYLGLLRDEPEPLGTLRFILPHGQVEAIMSKAGSTIK